MILSDIRRYLRNNKRASLEELSAHFAVEPDALRGMLDHLIAKGSVSLQASPHMQEEPGCGKSSGCGGCSFAQPLCSSSSQKAEIFNWNEHSVRH